MVGCFFVFTNLACLTYNRNDLTNIRKLGILISVNLVKDDMVMKNNDILNAVQEGTVKGEYENAVTRSALHIAIAVGIACAIIMTVLEWFVFKKFDFGKPFLIALTSGLTDILEWKHNKTKKMLVKGICTLLFAVFLLLMYIAVLTGVA